MQEYLHRTRLGGLIDGIGLHFFIFLLGQGWFLLLWGLCLQGVLAGAALYGLIMLIIRKARDGRTLRREKQLRLQIGGEMALERLLTVQPEQANFEIVMLLSLRYPLTMLKAGPDGILCTYQGKRVLICFHQIPASMQITAEHVLTLQRNVRANRGDRGILCAPCPLSAGAKEQANGEIPVSFYPRDSLIRLLGSANPATDAQLVALGRRKRAALAKGKWLAHMLSPGKAPRYLLYGLLLLGLYLLTHLPYYVLPGLCCLLLALLCRLPRQKADTL